MLVCRLLAFEMQTQPFTVSISSLHVFPQRSACYFSARALFVAFFSSILGGQRGSVVCAGYGDGGIWISSVACELRFSSVKRTEYGDVDDGYGSGSGFRAWIPYDFYDGVTDGGLRWMIPFAFYWRSTGGFPRFGYERFGHT